MGRRGRSRRSRSLVWICAALAGLLAPAAAALAHQRHGRIRHVVVVYQENHSFDNVLGRFCVRTGRCDGTRSAPLPGGSRIRLPTSPDVVPDVPHTGSAQETAIDGGTMRGWTDIPGCRKGNDYRCLDQFAPRQIPNLTTLARHFALSDRTFQMDSVSSWGAHLELVAATLDGFTGEQVPRDPGAGPDPRGWGCDSGLDTDWRSSRGTPVSRVPACVPDYNLNPNAYPYGGAYRPTPVKHVPTLMDELDRAGLSWKLYTATGPGKSGYGLSICPTFAGCIYTAQQRHQVGHRRVLRDARAGRLPNFSVVIPTWPMSQHNEDSMVEGDNWIGKVVDAIEHGPGWRSTAILISYDDCGCFYDHVPPPQGMGIRTPMVIASPWVKAHYTDSRPTPIASILAFTERTFDLPALTGRDAAAYAYRRAFDFHQRPLAPAHMTKTRIPRAERDRIAHESRPPGET